MLKISHLTKKFGSKIAVDDVSLEIKDGEIYGFIGHNGAGKTTTIKSIVGIQNFDSGEIEINGLSIKTAPIECKKILAYIPDNPDIFEYMTGMQYLNFISNVFNIAKDVRMSRITKYADMFELTQDLNKPVGAYSHGMKQKVAVISAFLHEPKLLLLDEPFVGLDPKASFILKNKMKELCSKGSSILFSSHVLEVVENLCDSIAIIQEGNLVKQSKTEDILKTGQTLEDLFLELEK